MSKEFCSGQTEIQGLTAGSELSAAEKAVRRGDVLVIPSLIEPISLGAKEEVLRRRHEIARQVYQKMLDEIDN
jgi:hypothetical protein